jgi:alpha-glucosidase (family GH31 glycosyl hydrolase)
MVLRGRKLCHSEKGDSLRSPSRFLMLMQLFDQYIALRYQLVPYVKKLFQNLQQTGRVIMRPLYFDFSVTDEFVRNATRVNDPAVVHQFMFGM